ncbi:hypothetical protein P9G84_31510 [Brevibacillus centrosporus]|uniref:hypothetical protein n=1 Tax=Brevibacillus centrosporus TaxID=54910 RepID=UPI0011427CA1|nr:hypothetical protein [Brevibacillus centrosporus]MEC2133386.1 hypothetical protein [Brevibacillus centrosporus]GED34873.1 hypothetical protein BCE02nite_60140 [Brevibacillus centrosporus]
MKALEGIWTPHGRVICYKCHGTVFPNNSYIEGSDRWLRLTSPQKLKDDHGITYCDKCGDDVQVWDHLAKEHNLVKRLREHGIDASMWQTGGMCSAVGINFKGTDHGSNDKLAHILVTYGEGYVDDNLVTYQLGWYNNDGEYVEDKSGCFDAEDDVFKCIFKMKDQLEEIENGREKFKK